MTRKLNLLLLTIFLSSYGMYAQSPLGIPVQGVIRTADGRSLTDGEYTLEFKIFGNQYGTGTAEWTSGPKEVYVRNGVYSVILGTDSDNQLDGIDGVNYLQLIVNGEALEGPGEELTRINLLAYHNLLLSGNGNQVGQSGNVGLGTTSPTSKLDVVGDIKLSGSLKFGGDLPEIQFKNSGANDKVFLGGGGKTFIAAGNSITSAYANEVNNDKNLLLLADSDIELYTSASNWSSKKLAMQLKSNGIRFGTPDLGMRTQFYQTGGGSTNSLQLHHENNEARLDFYDYASLKAYMGMDNNNLKINVENNKKLVFSASKVGINIDNPTRELDISGSLRVTDRIDADNIHAGGAVLSELYVNGDLRSSSGKLDITSSSASHAIGSMGPYDNVGLHVSNHKDFPFIVKRDDNQLSLAQLWLNGDWATRNHHHMYLIPGLSVPDPTPIDNPLEDIGQLQAVSFTPEGEQNSRITIVPEELQRVFPEMVRYDEEMESYVVASGQLVPVLVEGVKILKQEKDELEQRVLALEKILQNNGIK